MISYFRFNLIAALALTLNAVVAIANHFSLQSSTPSSRAVTLNVMVMDKQNLPLADLKREDFQLHDDQTIVPISMFSDEHLPVNYVLALDISRSVKSRFKQLVLTAKTIIRNNQSSDETFLIIFRGESEAVLPHFTADKAMLTGHLDSVSQWVGGQSAILDAAYLSVQPIADYKKANSKANRRYALILITDGFENSSYYGEKEVLKRLSEEAVQVFVIGLTEYLRNDNARLYEAQGQRAKALLARLAQETGGYAVFPGNETELDKVAQDVSRMLHTQYKIGFSVESDVKPGMYNKVKVKLIQKPGMDQYKVIAPKSYVVPQQ